MVRSMMAACLLACCLLTSPAFAEPEVFSKAGYEADRASVGESQKLHLLYFTASWCPPCQQMKKTTWVDESLVGWLNENAVVTPIDVDEEGELAQDFRVQAMPTMVVLRGGKELARTVGYQDPIEFRDWLVLAEAGEIENTFAAEMEAERAWEAKLMDIADRLEDASDLVDAEQDELALKAYIDAWEIVLDDGGMVEISGVEGETENARLLVGRFAPAREAFAALRNREEARLRAGDVTWDRLTGWAVLNDVIGDDASTIAWVERRLSRGEDFPEQVLVARLCDEALLRGQRFDVLNEIHNPEVSAQKYHGVYWAYASPEYLDSAELSDDEYQIFLRDLAASVQSRDAFYFCIALGVNDVEAARRIYEISSRIEGSPDLKRLFADAAAEAGVKMIELPD